MHLLVILFQNGIKCLGDQLQCKTTRLSLSPCNKLMMEAPSQDIQRNHLITDRPDTTIDERLQEMQTVVLVLRADGTVKAYRKQ